MFSRVSVGDKILTAEFSIWVFKSLALLKKKKKKKPSLIFKESQETYNLNFINPFGSKAASFLKAGPYHQSTMVVGSYPEYSRKNNTLGQAHHKDDNEYICACAAGNIL